MDEDAGAGELVAVWALYAAFAVAIAVTYSRLEPGLLYHVYRGGLGGGLGRAVVFLNFPTALVGIALAWLSAARLGSDLAVRAAAAATILCAAVLWPGVVDQADLDVKPINALAAVGVAIAAALTIAAVLRHGLRPLPRMAGDRARVALGVVLGVAALPWAAADLGFFIGRVPVLGDLVMSDQFWRAPRSIEIDRAVHLGHHHGMDGTLLAVTALVLTRPVGRLAAGRLRTALSLYLALMLVYGLANEAQDFWFEQVVKRGLTTHAIPNVLRPTISVAWLAIVVLAAAADAVIIRRWRTVSA